MMRAANAKPFPAMSNMFLVLSTVTAERNKQSAEIPEIIHAKVTKARAAKSLLQKLVMTFSLPEQPVFQHCFKFAVEPQIFHKPFVTFVLPTSIVLLKIKFLFFLIKI